jgi:chromosome segregation ATPase
MTWRTIFFTILLSVIVGGSVVRAQDAQENTNVPEPPAPAPQQVVEETPIPPVPKDREEYERRKTQFAPLTKDRTKNLLENVMNRLTSATARLDRIAVRIESRIGKEEALGADVEAARNALTRARAEIERARREAAMVTEVQMDLIVDSEAPRIAFQNLYTRIATTRTALENAKRELNTSLTALTVTPVPEDIATSTEESAPTTP